MLADTERQLEHYVTGRYAGLNRHALVLGEKAMIIRQILKSMD